MILLKKQKVSLEPLPDTAAADKQSLSVKSDISPPIFSWPPPETVFNLVSEQVEFNIPLDTQQVISGRVFQAINCTDKSTDLFRTSRKALDIL